MAKTNQHDLENKTGVRGNKATTDKQVVTHEQYIELKHLIDSVKDDLYAALAVNAPIAHKDLHDPEGGSDALDTALPEEISVVVAKSIGTAHSFARSDHGHQISHGIIDNHIVTIDSESITNGEYAKFTAFGLESKTFAEVRADLDISYVLGFSGVGSSVAAATTRYLGNGGGDVNTNEAYAEFYIPVAGVVKNLRVYVSTQNTADTCTVTLNKNTSSQTVTVTFGSGVTGLQADTSNSFSVAAGDRIAIQVVAGGESGAIVIESVSFEINY